jgi:hypothetical protein
MAYCECATNRQPSKLRHKWRHSNNNNITRNATSPIGNTHIGDPNTTTRQHVAQRATVATTTAQQHVEHIHKDITLLRNMGTTKPVPQHNPEDLISQLNS